MGLQGREDPRVAWGGEGQPRGAGRVGKTQEMGEDKRDWGVGGG